MRHALASEQVNTLSEESLAAEELPPARLLRSLVRGLRLSGERRLPPLSQPEVQRRRAA